ncbi:MAG: SDR family NAD(P)-dependent oxidoreductase [Gammaproteobacteria bacterium]|nr:SDR family NAD(P)-dependent oxidoreductase [Gammaproteobacteria bacterium]
MSSANPSTVALVTGATRGAGKGIAAGLAGVCKRVYVTGRSQSEATATLKGEVLRGTLDETVAAINAAGGEGVGIQCDHADDQSTKAVFERIESESGRLDILVNSAASIHDALIDPGGFWEKPLELADILDVGLRSAYVASYYAAPIMIRQGSGLIVFTSSFGGVCYMHGPAYGAQKAGYDKFAADMAVDLENTGVAVASLWLGPQRTERTEIVLRHRGEQYGDFMALAETPQFNGRVIHALHRDPKRNEKSGQTLITAELALEYGIQDEDGRQPPSYREQLGAPRVPHPARVI